MKSELDPVIQYTTLRHLAQPFLLHDSDILEGRRLPLVFSGHHAGPLVLFHSRFGLCYPKGLSPLPLVSAIMSRGHEA